MFARGRSTVIAVTMGILASACGGDDPEPAASATATPAPPLTVEEWRAKHDVDYRRDYVSIAGMHDLKSGVNTAGSAPGHDIVLPPSTPSNLGRFVRQGDRVRFEPVPGAAVRIGERAVTEPVDLRDDRTADRDELLVGEVRLVVHASGDSRMLRVRDPNGPLARGFLGFDWFPIDPQYRVVGRFIPDAAAQTMKVPNTFGDLDEFTSEGVVEFTLAGQTLTLRPFTTRPGRLYFVFRDASSGQETYKAARFLYADLLPDGTTVLDFNIAYNPPCAFNPYTTCPIPLAENRLPVKILAGEKKYPVDVELPQRN
jgi:uncharacterized protein (DUF1684 family)